MLVYSDMSKVENLLVQSRYKPMAIIFDDVVDKYQASTWFNKPEPEFVAYYKPNLAVINFWIDVAKSSHELGMYHPAFMKLEALYQAAHLFHNKYPEALKAGRLYRLFNTIVGDFMQARWKEVVTKLHMFSVIWQESREESRRVVQFVNRFQYRKLGYWYGRSCPELYKPEDYD